MSSEKQWTPCPSCGRPPISRGTVYVPHRGGQDAYVKTCDDSTHDKAEAGPALYDALELAVRVLALVGDGANPHSAVATNAYGIARAALAAARSSRQHAGGT